MEKVKGKWQLNKIPYWVIAVIVLLAQWGAVEYSATELSMIFERRLICNLLSFMILVAFNMLFALITRRLYRAFFITTPFFALGAWLNHYSVLFHGSPASFGLLTSVGTAINVAGTYHYPVNLQIVAIIIAFVVGIAGAVIMRRFYVRPVKTWRRDVAKLAVMIVLAFVVWVHTLGFVSDRFWAKNIWNMQDYMNRYGYLTLLVLDTSNLMHQYNEPEGYDGDEFKQRDIMAVADEGKQLPDVIFILNESFYDLADYADIETDIDYLGNYHSIKQAAKGYAVAPSYGGTNNTELELITGIPMNLLAGEAPFTFLNMSKVDSVVSYFNKLGYTTYGMHPSAAVNYNRKNAYPQLGFDKTYFGDDFTPSAYGNRVNTDPSNFRDMLSHYEEDEGPKFMYLLTYQNHGGYEQNDASYDLVHQSKIDDPAGICDEYLTGIYFSDQALGELIEHFEGSDRDVIIMMVGDHCPAVVTEISPKEELLADDYERAVTMLSVPYIIWTNFEADYQEASREHISMSAMAPLVLKMGGFPLNEYYETALKLSEMLPVWQRFGYYMDADGNRIELAGSGNIYEEYMRYQYMAYYNLKGSK